MVFAGCQQRSGPTNQGSQDDSGIESMLTLAVATVAVAVVPQ